MKKRTWWIGLSILGVAAIVAIVLIAGRRAPGLPQSEDRAASAPSVTLYTARVGTFVARVRAQGRVGTPEGSEARLAFPEAGIVRAVFAGAGERVSQGEALAQLDVGPLGLDAAQARDAATARLLAARERLNLFERGIGSAQTSAVAARSAAEQSQTKIVADENAVTRAQKLYDAGIAARKDVDAARETLALDRADAAASSINARGASGGIAAAEGQARAELLQAESDVRSAQRGIVNATLRASRDGVVTAVLKHAGEATDPSQPAVVLAAGAGDAITLKIDAMQAAQIQPGDAVSIAIPLRHVRSNGSVRVVIPGIDAVTQTATVVATGVPAGAEAGDAVDALISLDRRARRGILVPTEALVQDPESGQTIVFVREGAGGKQRFVARRVDVAAGDERISLLAGGLRSGERIAAQGAYDLLAPAGGG